jgi:hypothetical protein
MTSQLQKYKPPEVLKARSWDVEKRFDLLFSFLLLLFSFFFSNELLLLFSCPAWSTDMWYYGCLIYEIFNRSFTNIEEIKAKGNIPNSVFNIYKEFMKGDPKARLSPSQVLQKMCAKGEFFNNEFIQASSFLENFALKEAYEKDQFFRFVVL